MDRHPQQIKRERQDIKRRARNIDSMSRLRTNIKKVLSTTTKEDANKVYSNTVSIIDKAVSKNLIHKNTGSRRKAQITRHLNSLS
ncbi:MAG: 30S ribosomal protein S20 [Candidatus Marinimicrobia bacterium]|jgi:small subunit ribosomal protein S20|nr:30S ribosomal protein S20 [Candidatus Neomarinimicrobiota bacterium]MBT3501440.1 30S ribosomal protein S20 [Candidatus Neomarinimicrobiota bacterium]MBT3839421.1 30S ribosomal protein S20 [Candidatus Neomarinimicrobiota bacterium]MBT3998594.1 30S ribosomal protein S20 [Candidatus Neomarinimicrobiota bacterium]MBT4283066.1 30S ribosomal protein S20 [Candidatus Neomarinimicrobiota bacterium]